jgi:Fe-S-cluster containining protein
MIPVPLSRPTPDAALCGLQAIYDELDAHLARLGVPCRACGECCDFARNDYRLYASELERALVVARHGEPRLTPEGRCGFLLAGRCSIHASRPLGCRVFFCDPAHKPREQDLCHTYLDRLRTLADQYGLPWDYAPFFCGVAPPWPGAGCRLP